MAFNFKPCGCGWHDEKVYDECADHATLRAQRDALLAAGKAALDEFRKSNPFDRRGARFPSPAEVLMQDAVEKAEGK